MNFYISALMVILSFMGLTACFEKKDGTQDPSTEYLKEYNIPVPEPSGLDLTSDKRNFWIVSDETSNIYKLNANGEIVKRIKINGYDLEGVCNVDEEQIAVVLER
ncbi:MAG: SdiA-regulated domain-containing protein, partial [Nitrososphaeraceae archaeon]|nr:SdiA-regulated domain-containing protein [Nitrososphaeraceae archaeon]